MIANTTRRRRGRTRRALPLGSTAHRWPSRVRRATPERRGPVEYPCRDSNPDRTRPERVASADWATGVRRPHPGFEPGPPAYKAGAPPRSRRGGGGAGARVERDVRVASPRTGRRGLAKAARVGGRCRKARGAIGAAPRRTGRARIPPGAVNASNAPLGVRPENCASGSAVTGKPWNHRSGEFRESDPEKHGRAGGPLPRRPPRLPARPRRPGTPSAPGRPERAR